LAHAAAGAFVVDALFLEKDGVCLDAFDGTPVRTLRFNKAGRLDRIVSCRYQLFLWVADKGARSTASSPGQRATVARFSANISHREAAGLKVSKAQQQV
jgi:hypothetical protein